MGYAHIKNLYVDLTVLEFKEVYAMEKIHGSSAHVSFKDNQLKFFPGGEKYENFVKCFDISVLGEKAISLGYKEFTVYGEVYGGKCQGMKLTYGNKLCFIAFDVKAEGEWLSVPNAQSFTSKLDLDFVSYRLIPATKEAIDEECNKPSVQAFKNGVSGPDKYGFTPPIREGVVLRPVNPNIFCSGERIVAKHKRPEFSERKTTEVSFDPSKRIVLNQAEDIAKEWVTENRLDHVLDKLGNPKDISKIGDVIKAMIEDVTREAEGEIIDSSYARKAISKKTAQLYKARVTNFF